jgi:hypothetical protein
MATLNRIRYSNKVLSRKELNKALAVDPSYLRACEDAERARSDIRAAEQELTDISNETAKALPEEVECSRIERAVTNVAQRLKELREQRTKARSAAFRARRKANRDANASRSSATSTAPRSFALFSLKMSRDWKMLNRMKWVRFSAISIFRGRWTATSKARSLKT